MWAALTHSGPETTQQSVDTGDNRPPVRYRAHGPVESVVVLARDVRPLR
jgi:hypothetical protein